MRDDLDLGLSWVLGLMEAVWVWFFTKATFVGKGRRVMHFGGYFQ